MRGIGLITGMTAVFTALLLAPWLQAATPVPADDSDPLELEIADPEAETVTADSGQDITRDKSAAILAFTSYMLAQEPAERLKFLLQAIDHDPDAAVPLGCFIKELEKAKDRRKSENELAEVALRHPANLRLNMTAAFLMSSARQNAQVLKLFNRVMDNIDIDSLSDRDLPFFLNLVSIAGKAYLTDQDYEDGLKVFKTLVKTKKLRDNLKLLGYAALFFTAAAEKGSAESSWLQASLKERAARQRDACLNRIGNLCFRHYFDPTQLVLPLDLCKQLKETRRGTDMIYGLLLSRPDDFKSKLFLAVFYTSTGHDEEAFRLWREIVRSQPTNLKFSQELGKAADQAGHYKIAAAAYRNYLRSNPADKATSGRLALTELRAGEYNRALETAVAMPDDPLASYVAALACRQLRRYREAAEWLEKTEKLAYKLKAEKMIDREFHITLAHAWDRSGNKAKAEAVIRKVLERYPDDATANNFLGYLWAEQGKNLTEARRHLERALKKDPDNPAINDSMAWVLYRSGTYQEAEKYIRKALANCALVPDAVIMAHAGDIYWAAGKKREARECWSKALLTYSPDGEVDRKELKQKLKQAEPIAPVTKTQP